MLTVRGKTPEEILKKSDEAIKLVENLFLESPLPQFPIITKEQISAIPYDTKYDIADGVCGWRLRTLFDDAAEIVYCEFKAGSRLRFHKHDCIEEIVKVDGDFKNLDDRLVYEAGEVHELIAKGVDGRIIVKFT